jgi:GR25 family glycosyltransferase involved in LPS biosynthesis
MWTDYFDAIFLISLERENKRREIAKKMLANNGIKFQLVDGIENQDGEQGIMDTMIRLWKFARDQNFERILVFEDDFWFMLNPNLVMDTIIKELSELDWHLFYMGPNTHQPFEKFVTPNLLQLKQGYGLHATAYSKAGIAEILKHGVTKPVDVSLAANIQTLGKSFCCYPFVATQQNGYSSIQKKYMDQEYIEQRFYQNVKHLV